MSNIIPSDSIKVFPVNSGAVDRTLSEQNLSRLIKAILPGKKSFVVGEYEDGTDDKGNSISWVQFFIDGRLFDMQKSLLINTNPCYVSVAIDSDNGDFNINRETYKDDQGNTIISDNIVGITISKNPVGLKILDDSGNIPLDSLDSIDVDGGEI